MLSYAVVEKNRREDTRSCDELLKSVSPTTTRRCKSLSALKENINEVLLSTIFSQVYFMQAETLHEQYFHNQL